LDNQVYASVTPKIKYYELLVKSDVKLLSDYTR